MGKICFEVGKGKNLLFYLVLALKKIKGYIPPITDYDNFL